MKEKLKKQRRNISLKITSVLLIVWLFVSVVFSAIVLTSEKQSQITKSHNDYTYLVNCTTPFGMPYNEMCKYIQVVKEHYRDIVSMQIEEEEINCGADIGTYDTNMQITLFEFPIAYDDERTPSQNKLLMDTDKEIYFSFNPDDYSEYVGNSGLLNYDEFISSLTKDQLDTIVKYLNIEKDKDGYFYLLINKACYYNPENGHVYPQTVEIVKAYEDSNGYAVDEVVETYELNPKNVENLERCESMQNEPCIIDGQFICNDFASDGLIENPTESLSLQFYDPDTGIIEKNGLFTYTCYESGTYTIETIDFEGSELAFAYYNEQRELLDDAEVIGHYENYGDILQPDYPTKYVTKNIGIRYAKRINLLECCADTLIIGISSLFLFFLIIGIILTTMMYKVIKTQLIEEEKRREVTNALAHDIKTPLFIISGYAQNLKENINTDKRERYCEKIIERTDEVNSLVHKMLDFSKLEEIEQKLNIESVNVEKLINSVIEDYYNLPDTKYINLNVTEKCYINADIDLLKRAVSYLFDNAVRYSTDNTDIKISLTSDSLSISNACKNISEQDLKHLTEPYYRVEKNRESKGNGLGLSIVKSIVELHKFKLNIELSDSIITFTIKF